MGAGVWGWNPQLGDESPPIRLARAGRNNFQKKKVFERTLFEQKFSYIYTAYFLFKFSFEIFFFFERTAFKRKPKMKKIRKNGFQNKFFNFERTLFDQTTSSRQFHSIQCNGLSAVRYLPNFPLNGQYSVAVFLQRLPFNNLTCSNLQNRHYFTSLIYLHGDKITFISKAFKRIRKVILKIQSCHNLDW